MIIPNAEKQLDFSQIEDISYHNQKKVLNAFIKNKIGAEHFYTVSGYGHDDLGREAIDRVFADSFGAEKAIVRNHFVSGTHALACVMFGILRPGDKLLSVAGSPYDTLEEVIGKRENPSSLKSFGIDYDEVPLKNGLDVDLEELERKVDKSTTMALIQRSRGYSLRNSINIELMEKIIKIVKSKNPDCICFVDNCYGEFVEKLEPTQVGADIMAGSLIKNPGGGIVETGGYIAGRAELVELAAQRLTAPAIGSKGGAMLNQSRLILQGFFMAPSVTKEALKGAMLSAQVFSDLGYNTSPKPNDIRSDIIQAIELGDKEKLAEFCKLVQSNSPVESYLSPIPDNVAGYDNKLIMAAGTFIEGSTIELSADAPLREPYAAYFQGGLNYNHVKIVLEKIVEKL